MEDLWNNLREILPRHYSPYAPPSSYIDAGDFKSPKACNTAAGRERRPLFQIFLLEKKRLQSGEQAGGENFARHVTILNRNPKSTRIWRTGGIIKMLLPVSLDWIALTVYCKKSWQRPESNVCWQCLLLPWKIRSSMEKLTVSLRGGAVVAPLGR